MVEDIVIGVAIFIAFVALAYVGRTANIGHLDIWSSNS